MDKQERRSEFRNRVQGDGFFIQNSTLWELKLLDMNTKGMGASCNREFKPGARGLIFAPLPHNDDRESVSGEVTWCMRELEPEDPFYAYRIGFRLIDQDS